MKVLVCGGREWRNRVAIRDRLSKLPPGTVVIHGAARGVDRIAGEEAKSLGMMVHEFPAQWGKFGRAAGMIRNQRMLDEAPDLVLAFHVNLGQSRGTKDMVRRAQRRGIRVEINGRR